MPSIYQAISREFERDDVTFCMAIMSREALEAGAGHEHGKEIRARLATVKKALIRIELGTPATTLLQHRSGAPSSPTGFDEPPQAQSLLSSMTDWPSRTNAFASADRKHDWFKYF